MARRRDGPRSLASEPTARDEIMKSAATALLVALALSASSADAAVTRRARYLMGTVCAIAVDGPDASAEIEAAFAEARRIETMLSTWTDESELSRLNRGESPPSPELAALLRTTIEWSRRTNGAFDPRIRRLIDLWKTREEGAVPTAAALREARATCAAGCYEEGAFGKGYAIDRMLARMNAPAVVIDFGGQLGIRGTMRVTIADPRERRRPVLAFTLIDASLSTSSGSEKTFEAGGRLFSHLIDPRTGEALPPRGSVSVIAAAALTADILSTALYVMGEEEGLRWARDHEVAAIFINTANHIRVSPAARLRMGTPDVPDRNFQFED
jgi:thiamine biosynthesis lipoprotein